MAPVADTPASRSRAWKRAAVDAPPVNPPALDATKSMLRSEFLGIDRHWRSDYRRAAFRDVSARKVVCDAIAYEPDAAGRGRSSSAHGIPWAPVARWGWSHGRA